MSGKSIRRGLMIGGIVGAIVIILLVLVVLNPFAPGLVGKWYITKKEVGSKTEPANFYIEFHSNGTGKTYTIEGKILGTFHWKDLGNNLIEITDDETGDNVTMHYKIDGDKLELSYTANGEAYILYGERA